MAKKLIKKTLVLILVLKFFTLQSVDAAKPLVLCLHGGGMSSHLHSPYKTCHEHDNYKENHDVGADAGYHKSSASEGERRSCTDITLKFLSGIEKPAGPDLNHSYHLQIKQQICFPDNNKKTSCISRYSTKKAPGLSFLFNNTTILNC